MSVKHFCDCCQTETDPKVRDSSRYNLTSFVNGTNWELSIYVSRENNCQNTLVCLRCLIDLMAKAKP